MIDAESLDPGTTSSGGASSANPAAGSAASRRPISSTVVAVQFSATVPSARTRSWASGGSSATNRLRATVLFFGTQGSSAGSDSSS